MLKQYMYLPAKAAEAAEIAAERWGISEIRLRPGKRIAVFTDKVYFLTEEGNISESGGIMVSEEEFRSTFEKMCRYSVYAKQDNLKNGFIPLPCGGRAGVSGRVAQECGRVSALYDISAINIRISRQIFTAADGVIDRIAPSGKVENTLVISPPGCGKTTLLREVARLLGGGKYMLRVGIIDERCEIAAVSGGVPFYDTGELSFVYSACPKAEGMEMALRSMSPDVIICDEIGGEKDVNALSSAINAGVKIICSCHGYDRGDVIRRAVLGTLIEKNIFGRIIVLGRSRGVGTVERIY